MDVIEPLITALHAEGRLRVRSLVVTVFGDAAQHRGGRIATLRLQHLLERVGVEAGALRTALSRLTSDGWIVRDREGRNSYYRLSANAQAEISAASVDIYAAPASGKVSEWVMASGTTAPHKGIEVAANLWLIPANLAVDMPNHICLTGALASFPEDFAKQILSKAHQSALVALHNDISALKGANLTPLDAMAARMLLLHRWRRIVLRFPEVPPELFPASFIISNPRERVANAYGALSETSEAWLGSCAHGLAPMPASTATLAHRFI